ncbi:MAG: terminase large subunit [Ilumatobacteraceae bacterium]
MTAQSDILTHVDECLAGRANHWIRRAAARFRADLERSDVVMDWEEVERMVEFVEGLRLVGSHAGQAWTLLPWQRWVLASAIGWRWTDTGLPRTKMLLLQVARKNGKSTLMSGLCLWDLIGSGKAGRKVHVIANKREQARIVLETAMEMARPLLPAKTADGRKSVQLHQIVTDAGFMNAQTAADKSLDGLEPSLWVGDEVSEWRGRFITKLETATIGRPDPLGCLITTPGNNPDLIYPELVSRCEQVLEGELELDHYQAFIYGVDEEDDAGDEAVWFKANPSLGATLRIEALREQWKTMSLTEIGRTEFVRFHLARAVDVAGAWLDMRHWDAITEPAEVPDGAEVWVGVDLSKSFDMSAVVLARPTASGVIHLAGRYWYPQEHATEREISYQMPFRKWAAEGRLELSPGREIDWDSIMDWICGLGQRYRVRKVAVDPWNSAYFNRTLEARGLPVVEHSQGIGMMGPASQAWGNAWIGRRLRHSNDPILRSACANAFAKVDDAGNFRPSKRHSRGLIDPLVAAIMAVHAYGEDQSVVASMYEQGIGVG